MTKDLFVPRKQRTREHVIADQSINHVERYIIEEGHTAQRLSSDYGYDLVMFTYDEQGYAEPGTIFIQLKAAESLQTVGTDQVFDLDIRDYNLWMLEDKPVLLILFDAARRRAYWLAVQNYFDHSPERRPKRGAKTVRVRIPKRQVVNRRAVAQWRDLKREALRRMRGEKS
jgi:hypothetical protein